MLLLETKTKSMDIVIEEEQGTTPNRQEGSTDHSNTDPIDSNLITLNYIQRLSIEEVPDTPYYFFFLFNKNRTKIYLYQENFLAKNSSVDQNWVLIDFMDMLSNDYWNSRGLFQFIKIK